MHCQPTHKDGPTDPEARRSDGETAAPRSGEGSESALARLKDLERDRLWPEPGH
jgi:hypothetical protein